MSRISKNRAEFERQQKRLQKIIRQATKKGYIVPQGLIPEIPARVTAKSLSAIKAIKPSDIYAQTKYLDPITETFISGAERYHKEQQQIYRKRKAKRTQNILKNQAGEPPRQIANVIDNIRDLISRWEGDSLPDYQIKRKERHKGLVTRILNNSIEQDGEATVAARIEANATRLHTVLERMLYGDSKEAEFQGDLVEFSTLLRGQSLGPLEAQELADFVESLNIYDEE